jgi:GTP-binding protein Era
LIKPKNALGDYMVRSVTESVAGVDACMLVVEAGSQVSKADEELIKRFRQLDLPAVLAINKIDLLQDKSVLMGQIAELAGRYDFSAVVPVSARDGDGIEDLKKELKALSMEGGHFFSEDTLTDQPERVIAAEIVREKILRLLEKEIPHGVAVVTERMRERGEITDIDATIYTEKDSHKGILIGKGGAMLKKIGSLAREDMERFFGCKINLQLWVKVKEDWRLRPNVLQSLGFDQSDFDN